MRAIHGQGVSRRGAPRGTGRKASHRTKRGSPLRGVEMLESRIMLSIAANPVDDCSPYALSPGQEPPVTSLPDAPLQSASPQFDLRTLGLVTPVRNQGACGSCWAFATYGSLESAILAEGGGRGDFSENNLKDYHGFDLGPCAGGNQWMSDAYLSRGSGPVHEADDPYHDWDDRQTPAPTLPAQAYVRDCLVFDTDEEIKWALQQSGALYTSMIWINSAYNSVNNTYYYSSGSGTGHAVTIVGWDDTKLTAGGTGAWLIKNSWGSSWGNGGYFWLSYADVAGGNIAVSFCHAVDPGTFGRIYTHDWFGRVTSVNVSYAMNAFTAAGAESLVAAQFWTQVDGASYDLRIYDTFSGGVLSGLLASQTGSCTHWGRHTVDLPSAIPLAAGNDFYVYVQITNGGTYPQTIDMAYSGWASASTASPGQSYYSSNGNAWTDLTTISWFSTANFCIKALTAPVAGQIRGQVYNDLDRDGTRDGDEPGLAGWTITLDRNADGTPDASVLTAADGSYAFTGLASGAYRVSEALRADWTQSAPAGATYSVVLAGDEVVEGRDFGDYWAVAIGGPAGGLEGSPITLTAPTGSGFTWSWDVTKVRGSQATPHYAGGTASSLSFTPDNDGAYTATLVVVDGQGARSTTASLTTTVRNAAPQAADDSYAIAEDGVLAIATGGVLANDHDVPADTLLVSLLTGPAHGLLTLDPDGSFTYAPSRDYHGADGFTYRVDDGTEYSNVAGVAISVSPVTDVTERYVFYNNSAFDGYSPDASDQDYGAIAPGPSVTGHGHTAPLDEPDKELGKQPLLPGQTATFVNYTSYSKGINGIMIAFDALADPGALTAADFVFRVGNDHALAGWTAAPAPLAIRVDDDVDQPPFRGQSDVVTILWADEDPYTPAREAGAISWQWLRVTVLDTPHTGLAAEDVFSWGNQIGESGNSTRETTVDQNDEIGVRNHPHTAFHPAPLDDPYDFDRDGKVDANDEILARNNPANVFSRIVLLAAAADSAELTAASQLAVGLVAWEAALAHALRSKAEAAADELIGACPLASPP